jgi:hypothetical protein
MLQQPRRKQIGGVYAGSGVARGGQQGKSSIGNGVVGVARGGGPRVGATPARPTNSHGPAFNKPKPIAQDPYRRVTRNGQSVLVRLSRLTPAERLSFNKPAPGQPGAIEDPVAAMPGEVTPQMAPPSFDAYRDSTYWDELRAEQRAFDEANNPLVAKLASLNARGAGGKTLYDLMYEQANSAFHRNKNLSRGEAAKRGVTRSGYMDRTLSELGANYLSQQDQLMREYGNDVNDQRSAAYQIVQQQKDLERRMLEAQANLARSASQRGLDAYMAQLGQAFTPYFPEAG